MDIVNERRGLAKVGFYFDGAAGIEREALVSACRSLASARVKSLPDGVRQRLAARVTEMAVLPHQRVMAASPKPFDVAYQISSPDEADLPRMAEAVSDFAFALGERIDRSTAAVFMGREIAITSGDGPIYNIMPLRRLPALDHEAFMHHWFDRHAALGEGVAGVRYRQNHVDVAATDALAARLGLVFAPMDGITESYFDSVDAAVALLSRDEVAIGAIDDERLFIDHSRSQFAIYETVWRDWAVAQIPGGMQGRRA